VNEEGAGIPLEPDKVVCRSEHTYATTLHRFYWEGQWHQVWEVRQAWREPGERCFQVLTDEGRLFQLCYSEAEDRWRLTEVVEG